MMSFILFAEDQLLLPPWLLGLLQPIHRVVYWLSLPSMICLRIVSPPVAHHVPAWHPLVAGTATALGLCIALKAWLSFRKHVAARRAADGTEDVDQGRRITVRQVLLGTVGGTIVGLGGYASLIEPDRLTVRRFTVPIADLPPWAHGLTLLHVSDTHYGPLISLPFLEQMVEVGNELAPDLVVLTGDYVHRTPKAMDPGVEVLTRLHGRLPTVAVLGNHDHWEDPSRCRQILRRGGVEVIDNRALYLSREGFSDVPTPQCLCIAGLGDLWEDEHLPELTLGAVPAQTPRIVAAHNPDTAELSTPDTRMDLMLSGHTHGGQVAVPFVGTPVVPSRYGQKYAYGLCHGPHCPVIVSAGVGMTMLPVRFGVPPEIGLITLVSDRSERG